MGRGRVVEMNRDAESFELLRSEISDLRDELANLKAGLNLYDPLRRLKSDLDGQTDHLGNLTVTREGLSEALGRVLAGRVYERPEIPRQYVQPAPPPEFPKWVVRYDTRTGEPLELATVFDIDAGISYSRDGWMQCRDEREWQYAVKALGSEGLKVWTEIDGAGQRVTRREEPEIVAGTEEKI